MAPAVVREPAYFGFIILCHQGDKPRRSRVRNLITRKVLTRFLRSTTSWLRDDVVLVVSLCRVGGIDYVHALTLPICELRTLLSKTGTAMGMRPQERSCLGTVRLDREQCTVVCQSFVSEQNLKI